MLQKIVNGIAIASGVVSLTVVGVAGYVFIRKDAIIENVKSKVMESVLPGGLGTGALEGLGGGFIPDMDSMAPDTPTRQTEQSPMTPPAGTGFGVPSF